MKEIKEAAKVILYQLDMRFPQMQVLSTFMLFSVTFNRAQVKKEVVDTKLRILSDHLAYDLAICQSEFDDLMDEVTVAKSKGMATDMDLWGHLLPRLESRDVQMRLVEAVHLFFCLQCQNGTLERNFSHKRRQENRLQGGWSPEGVDARLRVRLEGLPPRELLTYADGGPQYHDDLVRVAHALTPKIRSSPQKNQLSLAEIVQSGAPVKKARQDKGQSHKAGQPANSHASESLGVKAVAGHSFFVEEVDRSDAPEVRTDLVVTFDDGDL